VQKTRAKNSHAWAPLKKVFITWQKFHLNNLEIFILKVHLYPYLFQVEGHQFSTQLFFLWREQRKEKEKTVIPLLEHIQLDTDTLR
jgi:hypothetical protein